MPQKIPLVLRDKNFIIAELIKHFTDELEALKKAALATYEAATNEESKPENEYDTRGLEASYLAGAQAERVAEVEELIFNLKALKVVQYNEGDPVSSTAVLRLKGDKSEFTAILLPGGGGVTLKVAGESLRIVTSHSPLGEALMGLYKGDSAVVDVGNATKEYEILDIS